MLENDDNIASLLDPGEERPRGKYRAQWNDDYHHAWHVLLTGKSHGYYKDYQDSPRQHIARALGSGFGYQGEPSKHRGGRLRGEPSRSFRRSPSSISCRTMTRSATARSATGSSASRDPKAIEAALVITLLAPTIPMLFMGEEWGSKAPFPFFCDFKGELANAVRNGRRKEFASAYDKYGDDIPDPSTIQTVQSATLDWGERIGTAGTRRLTLIRELLAIRRREIVPRLAARIWRGEGGRQRARHGPLAHGWRRQCCRSPPTCRIMISPHRHAANGTCIWGGALSETHAAWSVRWHIG